MNLIKILILGYVLEPVLSLHAIHEAFRRRDPALEDDDPFAAGAGLFDPQDPIVRSMRASLWS